MVDQIKYKHFFVLLHLFFTIFSISSYHIHSFLIKFCASCWFDSLVNSGRVVVEQAFGALKNRWCILKAFKMLVDKAALVTLA